MVFSFLLFVFFLLFFVFLPAVFLCKLLKIQLPDDAFITVGLFGVVGIVQLTLITFILRFLGLEFWALWILPVISLLYLFIKRTEIQKINIFFNRNTFFIVGVLLLCVLAQNLILFPAGQMSTDGYLFPFMHDTMWGIALLVELSKHFPPQNPAMLGLPLVNNHYFYPLFLASIYKITSINVIDLYFHFAPFFVSVLFGLGLYSASSLFTKSVFFRAVTIFLGFFCGNISYVLILFYGSQFNWEANTFLADQPFDQIVNPYTILGFSFILFCVFIISKIIDNRNKIDLGWSGLLILITGVSYGFKSFGGIILLGGLTGSVILYSLLKKKRTVISIVLLTCVLFVPIFFLITEPSKARLNFYPGWVLTEMMTKNDGLNLQKYGQIESFYRTIGNTLGLLKIKLIEFGIYFIGNLGVRIFGVFFLITLLWSRKKSQGVSLLVLLYIIFCIVISFSIPLFFNLNVTAYNIVQFTPYSLVLLGVLTSIFFERLYVYLKKKNHQFIGALLILLFILLALPTTIKNLSTKFTGKVDAISSDEMQGITYIKNNTAENTVLIIDPRRYNQDPIYIPAVTQRRVYLASPGYMMQTGKDPDPKLSILYKYFDEKKGDFEDKQTLGNNYVLFLKKPNTIYFLKKTIEEGLRTLFENGEVLILGK